MGITEESDRGISSYLKGERVPKNRCVMTEGIRKCAICELYGQRWDMKELRFRTAASGISR